MGFVNTSQGERCSAYKTLNLPSFHWYTGKACAAKWWIRRWTKHLTVQWSLNKVHSIHIVIAMMKFLLVFLFVISVGLVVDSLRFPKLPTTMLKVRSSTAKPIAQFKFITPQFSRNSVYFMQRERDTSTVIAEDIEISEFVFVSTQCYTVSIRCTHREEVTTAVQFARRDRERLAIGIAWRWCEFVCICGRNIAEGETSLLVCYCNYCCGCSMQSPPPYLWHDKSIHFHINKLINIFFHSCHCLQLVPLCTVDRALDIVEEVTFGNGQATVCITNKKLAEEVSAGFVSLLVVYLPVARATSLAITVFHGNSFTHSHLLQYEKALKAVGLTVSITPDEDFQESGNDNFMGDYAADN